MEELLVVVVVALIGLPVALSIVALVLAEQARRRATEARRAVDALAASARAPAPPPAAPATAAPARPAPPPAAPARPAPAARPPPVPAATRAPVTPAPTPNRPAASIEQAIGGRVASFVGIAVLVTGLAFLVAYAIQNRWLGPRARVVLGLCCGAVLVGLGHVAERRGRRLHILARALTGGGAALFYFCVFAAQRLYGLIGMAGAAAGLAASAAAVLGLAWVYESQAVAAVGVLGAFLTPVLVGSDVEDGVFPLAYVALINLPVALLGLRRGWQLLYNAAFLFTAAYSGYWLQSLSHAPAAYGLVFASVTFVEFAALGLLKLRGERTDVAGMIDMVRLGLNSLLLMGLLYWMLERHDLSDWEGIVFLAVALVHVGLARAGRTWLPTYGRDILTFLVGALTFASLALPLQLDGAWVSVGWGLEGFLLAWFALRVGSAPLQGGALFLGLLGLGKSLLFDMTLYTAAPVPFLNGHFGASLLNALFLGGQTLLLRGASTDAVPDERRSKWTFVLACCAVFGLLGTLLVDAFWTMELDEPLPWMLTSGYLLAVAAALARGARGFAPFAPIGLVVLVLAALKLTIVDLPACYGDTVLKGWRPFVNAFVAVHALFLAGLLLLNARFRRWADRAQPHNPEWQVVLHIVGLLGLVALLSAELWRADRPWSSPAMTVWWAGVALVLVLQGLSRRVRTHRYLGLSLFGLATLKAALSDLGALRGLERVGALVGLGLLLLVLSFAYQRLSSYFSGDHAS